MFLDFPVYKLLAIKIIISTFFPSIPLRITYIFHIEKKVMILCVCFYVVYVYNEVVLIYKDKHWMRNGRKYIQVRPSLYHRTGRKKIYQPTKNKSKSLILIMFLFLREGIFKHAIKSYVYMLGWLMYIMYKKFWVLKQTNR